MPAPHDPEQLLPVGNGRLVLLRKDAGRWPLGPDQCANEAARPLPTPAEPPCWCHGMRCIPRPRAPITLVPITQNRGLGPARDAAGSEDRQVPARDAKFE